LRYYKKYKSYFIQTYNCNVKIFRYFHKSFIALSLPFGNGQKINPSDVPVGENCLYKLQVIAVKNFCHSPKTTCLQMKGLDFYVPKYFKISSS
jgi:hypothetical protein